MHTLDHPVDELVSMLAPQDIATLSAELDETKATLKQRSDKLQAVLERVFGDRVTSAYQIAKKDAGTVHIPASNTLRLTVERDNDVKWDTEILRSIRDQMSPDERALYLREKIEVKETIFKSAPDAIKKAFAPARTVKVGRPKFTFKVMETT